MGGFVGKALKNENGGGRKYGRISGLDAAKPGFSSNNPATHLSKDDAEFVDVIHTDSITFLNLGEFKNNTHISSPSFCLNVAFLFFKTVFIVFFQPLAWTSQLGTSTSGPMVELTNQAVTNGTKDTSKVSFTSEVTCV